MFKRVRLRLRDMKTISKLITGADKHANSFGEEKPGAEHFVLSALNLPDGSASRVFQKFGIDSDKFREAIKEQYRIALTSVGIDPQVVEIDPEPFQSEKIFKSSQPSGVELMKSLHALKEQDKDRPLSGAHVIAVVASQEFGVTARALKVLGVDRDDLSNALREELKSI